MKKEQTLLALRTRVKPFLQLKLCVLPHSQPPVHYDEMMS